MVQGQTQSEEFDKQSNKSKTDAYRKLQEKLDEIDISGLARSSEDLKVRAVRAVIDRLNLPDFVAELREQLEDNMFSQEMKKAVHEYINSFRMQIGKYLKPSSGQRIDIVRFPSGVILDIHHKEFIPNADNFLGNKPSLTEAFAAVNKKVEDYLDQTQLKDYYDKIKDGRAAFDDTNYFVGKTLLIIKPDDINAWSQERALKDADKILNYAANKAKEKGFEY